MTEPDWPQRVWAVKSPTSPGFFWQKSPDLNLPSRSYVPDSDAAAAALEVLTDESNTDQEEGVT